MTPLDFSLPQIIVPGSDDPFQCEAKYYEELREWGCEKIGTLNLLIEAWDCLMSAHTWMLAGGGLRSIKAYCDSLERLYRYHFEGLPVQGARALMLIKNASRGYHDQETCIRIHETGGFEWKP